MIENSVLQRYQRICQRMADVYWGVMEFSDTICMVGRRERVIAAKFFIARIGGSSLVLDEPSVFARFHFTKIVKRHRWYRLNPIVWIDALLAEFVHFIRFHINERIFRSSSNQGV